MSSSLPTHWCGYEGVDAVVLSTSRPEIYRKLAADGAADAGAGRVGSHGRAAGVVRRLAGGEDPCRRCAAAPVRPRPAGEDGAAASDRGVGELLREPRRQCRRPATARRRLRVPRLADVQGTIEAREADLPLVVRTARGFGQVMFVAADLDQPPLDKWPDRPLLVAKLLDMPTGHGEESEESTAMMHFGYSDLSGQLRSALDRFAGVRLAPFWLVAGLIVAYLLLIGPGDYFFLRKLVGRMDWTWLTFPLVVLLVCAGGLPAGLSAQGRSDSRSTRPIWWTWTRPRAGCAAPRG